MIKKQDTKSLLAESMLDMSRRKPVDKITVTDITKNCGLSRESFYYHFHDKYELVAWIYTTTADRIMSAYIPPATWAQTLGGFIQYLHDHFYFFSSALQDENINGFHEILFQYTVSAMDKSISERLDGTPLSEELSFQLRFYAHGAVNMTTEWLQHSNVCSSDEFGGKIALSMSPVLQKWFP